MYPVIFFFLSSFYSGYETTNSQLLIVAATETILLHITIEVFVNSKTTACRVPNQFLLDNAVLVPILGFNLIETGSCTSEDGGCCGVIVLPIGLVK